METRTLILITTLTALLSACTTDDSLCGGSATSDRPVLLQFASVDVRQEEVPSATRAGSTTTYPTDQAIGFYVKAENGYKARANIKGTYNTTLSLWKPEEDIWLVSKYAYIMVYAPYNSSMPAGADMTLTAGKYSTASSYMYATYTVNNVTNPQSVTLGFVYARLVFTVSRHASYDIPATVSDLKVSGTGIYTSATFSPFVEPSIANETGNSVTLTPDVSTTLDLPTTTATYDLLLIPDTLTTDVQADIAVDGHTMRVVIPKEKFAGSKFEVGKQYNVNLKLRPGKLDLASVSVEKWDALAAVNGGNGEFDQK